MIYVETVTVKEAWERGVRKVWRDDRVVRLRFTYTSQVLGDVIVASCAGGGDIMLQMQAEVQVHSPFC